MASLAFIGPSTPNTSASLTLTIHTDVCLTKNALTLLKMTEDTDFVENRLRLEVFLKVVEHGMPQRPSRFPRRQVTHEQLRSHSDKFLARSQKKVSERTGTSSTATVSTSPTIISFATRKKTPFTGIDRIYNVPCSPWPVELEDGNFDHNQSVSVARCLAREDVPISPCSGRRLVLKTASSSRIARSKPLEPRKNQKICLPIHTLPLVRMPTHGLPESCVRK